MFCHTHTLNVTEIDVLSHTHTHSVTDVPVLSHTHTHTHSVTEIDVLSLSHTRCHRNRCFVLHTVWQMYLFCHTHTHTHKQKWMFHQTHTHMHVCACMHKKHTQTCTLVCARTHTHTHTGRNTIHQSRHHPFDVRQTHLTLHRTYTNQHRYAWENIYTVTYNTPNAHKISLDQPLLTVKRDTGNGYTILIQRNVTIQYGWPCDWTSSAISNATDLIKTTTAIMSNNDKWPSFWNSKASVVGCLSEMFSGYPKRNSLTKLVFFCCCCCFPVEGNKTNCYFFSPQLWLLHLSRKRKKKNLKKSWLPVFWKKIPNTQEIKRTLFNNTEQDKTCKFSM